MNKRIYLVTGAAGFLGSNITRQLIKKGEKVRGLVLKGDASIRYIPKEVDIVFGDITEEDSLEGFFRDLYNKEVYVIHCASIVTVNANYNKKVYEVNVQGTKNIIKKCLQYKVKRLVYISSTSAIKELPKGEIIREVNTFSKEGIIGFYGQTKAEASQIVMDAVRDYNLDASIVFPTGICGPNDYANGPVSSFIKEYISGKMPAGIEGNFNAVDVRDLAKGCIAAAENGRKGEGYIMSNELVSMAEMFEILSKVSGCKKVKNIIPAFGAKIIGVFGDIKSRITGKTSKMTSFSVYNMLRNNNFDSSKAENELKYKVRPFVETMKDEINWMKEENMI